MKTIYILTATFMAGLMSACATYTPPVERDIDKVKRVDDSFDRVWQQSTEWFANKNIPIKNIVKDSGLIATDYRLGTNADYLDCGTVGTYESFTDKSLNFNVIVKSVGPNLTSVQANTFGTGSVSQMDLSGRPLARRTVDCVSTGKLEEDLFKSLSAY